MSKTSKETGIEQKLIDINQYLTCPGECKCGGKYVYHGLGTYECENCGTIFKNEYGIVRDFVDKYGTNYSIFEIAEKTGVPKRIIDLFIKDGKFITVEKQKVCIICHQPIESGVYCNKCALRQIQSSFENNRKKLSSGVRAQDMKGEMHYGKRAEMYENRRNRTEE